MFWLCKALLRYKRDGIRPVSKSQSEDPATREIEIAFVVRSAEMLLKIPKPEIKL